MEQEANGDKKYNVQPFWSILPVVVALVGILAAVTDWPSWIFIITVCVIILIAVGGLMKARWETLKQHALRTVVTGAVILFLITCCFLVLFIDATLFSDNGARVGIGVVCAFSIIVGIWSLYTRWNRFLYLGVIILAVLLLGQVTILSNLLSHPINAAARLFGDKPIVHELQINNKGFLGTYQLTGEGVLLFSNGDVYEGNFLDGDFDGHGKLTFYNGDVYEGDFVDGERTGQGVLTRLNGDVYEGNFLDGDFDGHGKLTFYNGNVYEGDFSHGERVGTGTFRWFNGDVYEGEFFDDRFNGYGVLIFANGNVYEGDFVDGGRTGQGVFSWSNGNVYAGNFNDGERTGYGVFTRFNGDVYEGDFLDGNFNGYGVMAFANGDAYEGDFVGGTFDGYGKYTFADGTVQEGRWSNDQYIGA